MSLLERVPAFSWLRYAILPLSLVTTRSKKSRGRQHHPVSYPSDDSSFPPTRNVVLPTCPDPLHHRLAVHIFMFGCTDHLKPRNFEAIVGTSSPAVAIWCARHISPSLPCRSSSGNTPHPRLTTTVFLSNDGDTGALCEAGPITTASTHSFLSALSSSRDPSVDRARPKSSISGAGGCHG